MKYPTVEDARMAWRKQSRAMQTGCCGCSEQKFCRGNRRSNMCCLACFIRANMRASDVRKLEQAGVL